ncbi:Na+/H+ antiporter NhaA [Rhodothermus marinus]|uniref:Na(+)/H(+) antiporter NhaA n=1 Tax=Rhodothermus marinus (strain ATCC 43812 / DSM 4252 / R-10) TaxID=518766 RepID=D0MGH5_RHOM4|nr:Na+/H+ antiporter NhaA [Rhodothermus marinus DSM 4252]
MQERGSRITNRLFRPFQEFFHTEAASGTLLLLSAVIALVWANSPWGETYRALWETKWTIGPEGAALSKSLLHWINDGLMVLFFLLVGLEIKRELLVGELSSPRKAGLAIAGAIGGMIVPALLYLTLNAGGAGERGWGIPMATDIAFALGVLALLGRGLPVGLRVFLAALAIVDDLGAVLVIALFYTADLSVGALLAAAVVWGLLWACNLLGVRQLWVYGLLGVLLWLAVFKSGVHATVAGVLLALTIPARRKIDGTAFLREVQGLLDVFRKNPGTGRLLSEDQRDAVYSLEQACERVEAPLTRMEHRLHGLVAYGIMPLFALANAGVVLGGDSGLSLTHPVTLGVVLGLLLGKPIGVLLASWLAVRLRLAELPAGVTWGQLLGVGCLCGIGFTMALFIAGLAFPTPLLLDQAKLGILGASLLAGLLGWVFLARARKIQQAEALSE